MTAMRAPRSDLRYYASMQERARRLRELAALASTPALVQLAASQEATDIERYLRSTGYAADPKVPGPGDTGT